MRFLKSSIMIVGLVFSLFTSVNAQNWATDEESAFTKTSSMLSVGVAVWPYGVNVAYERAFHEAISGSVYTGFMMYPYYDFPIMTVPLFVRAAFHPFNLKVLQNKIPVRDKVDVYVGLVTGGLLSFWSKPGTSIYPDPTGPSPFQVGPYIGVRYHFHERFSFFAEECGEFPYLNGGISMKL